MRVVIDCPGGVWGTSVTIDGKQVQNVREVTFHHLVSQVPELTLTYVLMDEKGKPFLDPVSNGIAQSQLTIPVTNGDE